MLNSLFCNDSIRSPVQIPLDRGNARFVASIASKIKRIKVLDLMSSSQGTDVVAIVLCLGAVVSAVGSIATIVESKNSGLWVPLFVVLSVCAVLNKLYGKRTAVQVGLMIAAFLLIGLSYYKATYVVETPSTSQQLGQAQAALKSKMNGNNQSVPNVSHRNESVILVPPFENVTGHTSEITIEIGAGVEDQSIKTKVVTDKYSEAPRTVLEDILVSMPNVSIVERQQLDKLLLESEYSRSSGIVDQKYAIEIGKQLGATAIAMGTITNIDESNSSFQGYNVKTNKKTVKASVRIRLIDIKSGRITFSTTLTGQDDYTTTNFGGTQRSDLAFSAVTKAIETLRDNQEFMAVVSSRQQ